MNLIIINQGSQNIWIKINYTGTEKSCNNNLIIFEIDN